MWARESQLHVDVLAGTKQGMDSLGIEYDVQVPPHSDPTVRVGLNIFKIREIDIATSKMQLSAWVRITWKDPRLAWNASHPAVRQIQALE